MQLYAVAQRHAAKDRKLIAEAAQLLRDREEHQAQLQAAEIA